MVSEIPVVRVAADVSSSSAVRDSKPNFSSIFTFRPSSDVLLATGRDLHRHHHRYHPTLRIQVIIQLDLVLRITVNVLFNRLNLLWPRFWMLHFTNKSISIRLDETHYLLWRQQVLFTIESLDLSSHIDGTFVVPSQYVLVNSEKVPNPQYASFKQHDSALCSWLLASISLSILPSLVSCRTAFEIWEKIQQIFSVSSTTKIMHLHCSLKNLRKRDQGMREYLAQIQSVCDSLAACGNPLSETMHISAILFGLPSDYEPVVAVITSSQQPYKLDGVCGVLLDTEARLQETHSANLVQNSSLGYDGYQFSPSSGPNMFVDQAYYPFVGQVSSGAPISASQKSGRSFSRGRGRVFGGRVRPQCQLCGRIGHLVNRCYYHFDRSYDGYSVNLVEEVVDCQKPEGESFHQDHNGDVALVSEDFSPVVCEEAAWFPDSGATAHLTPDLGKFHSSFPYTGSGKITVANGMAVPISRIGSSSLSTNSRSLFLSNLLHVPCVNKNLLFVSRFTKDNSVSVEFFPNSCVVKDLGTQQVMLRGLESNGLYKFFSKQEDLIHRTAGSCESHQDSASFVSFDKSNSADAIFSCNKSVTNVLAISDIVLWHRRLGHPSDDTLRNTLPIFPKISLISKSVDSQQVQTGCTSTTNQVPAPLSSAFKFPAKLLVYQRRPKVSLQSTSLPSQQAVFCFHQEPSTGFSQGSSSSGGVLVDDQQSSAVSLPIHASQESSAGALSNVLDLFAGNSDASSVSSSVLSKAQECSARKSHVSASTRESSSDNQSSSEVSQGSSNSLVSSVKVSCHPMFTRSKTGLRERLKEFSADELRMREGQVLSSEDQY
ncbi:hypothetical protein GQ457_10G020200 [Hibiscus cannabinus]